MHLRLPLSPLCLTIHSLLFFLSLLLCFSSSSISFEAMAIAIPRATLLTSASPSSSNPTIRVPYNIFINHCSPDTGHTLATSIYNTLKSMGFEVFLDREELDHDVSISSEIVHAITSSFIHIAIFSPRYAESSWCLAELLLMLKTEKRFIPVFYNVDPSDIRLICNGKGIYAEAFSKKEATARYQPQTLEEWKRALETVSNLKGHIVINDESESTFLENLQELIRNNSPEPHIQQEENSARSGEERSSHQVEGILPPAVGSPQIQGNEGHTSNQNDVENPRGGLSRTQIREAVKEKWKYVKCSLVLAGISLAFFSSDLRSHTQLSPMLVEISLSTVCVILGVLFFMIYDKIMKEHRVRRANNETAVIPCKPHQLILLALSACVASAVYIYFAINELKEK